jgi:hypothetical protein
VNEVLEQSDPFLLLDRHVREHVIAQNFPPTQVRFGLMRCRALVIPLHTMHCLHLNNA